MTTPQKDSDEMNSSQEEKVIVTDIQMPFTSMIIFMVKWAIASIPAFIILSTLGLTLLVIAKSILW